MKLKIIILILIISMNSFAQEMKIINYEGEEITILISNSKKTKEWIEKFNGVKDDSLKKKWTSRTYKLSSQKILIEFFDGQSALIENEQEFEKLKNVRFVKNNLWNFKKNISYKIVIPFDEARTLSNSDKTILLTKYKSDIPEYYDFKIYGLTTNQILFIDLSLHSKSATIYQNIKTLSSENSDIEEIEYGYDDDEYYMKELARGNTFNDFEPNEHLVYPKFIDKIMKNHDLVLKETKIFVDNFWGNLYQSKKGYWVLIDEVNQQNGSGQKMPILTLRIFDEISQVRKAEIEYAKSQKTGITTEHFYQRISDQYGKEFPNYVDSLISELPKILNFDEVQLSIDDDGLEIIDEAIKWNHNDWKLFDKWFPSVLAYYGKFYIQNKKIGKWESKFDKEYNIWIPQIVLKDKTSAFDMRDFYKDLLEYPAPLKWAGDFDGKTKERRRKRKK